MTDDLDRTERRIGNAEIIRRLDSIDTSISRIERVVFVGNGQKPLTERTTAIETAQGRVSLGVIFSAVGSAAATAAAIAAVIRLGHS